MKRHNLLLTRYTGKNLTRSHTGKVMVSTRNRRWCADGFEIVCDNRERVCVLFGMDCCDREVMAFAATTGGYSADMAQSVLLACVEARFHSTRASQPVEWLTDNGSCFTALETRNFARELGVECRFTPVRSPQSNGMAESFVKTFKRDYVFCHALPDAVSVLRQLPVWFEDYNENAPHKSLRMLSPREFIRSLKPQTVRFYRGNSKPQIFIWSTICRIHFFS